MASPTKHHDVRPTGTDVRALVLTRVVTRIATLVLAVHVPSATVHGQAPAAATLAWFDVSGARVQQPTSALRSALSVGGGLWHARKSLAVAAEGNVTVATDSTGAAQYVLRTTWLPAAFARTDIDVSATTNSLTLPGRYGSRAAAVRQSINAASFQLSVLAGAGRTSRFALDADGQRIGAALAWERRSSRGIARVGAQVTHNRTNDFKLMEASGIVLERVVPAYTMTDRQLDAIWQQGPLWLQASRAWRYGTGATLGKVSAFHLSAAWTVQPSTTLIAQVGEQLADVVRGVPQARYTTLGVRWNPIRPSTLRRDARALSDDRGGTNAVTTVPDIRGDEVVVQRRPGQGDLVISIVAPADASVDVATSATEWAPAPAVREGERFVYRLTLPSGAHKVAVRVNGGSWRAPRGLAVVDDDFGGQAGVVVIP